MFRRCAAPFTLAAAFAALCEATLTSYEVEESSCDVSAGATSFLQTQVRRQPAPKEQCGRLELGSMGDALTLFNNNYKFHTHKDDFNKSVLQVMREHPGVDGYCYFNASAMYIQYNGETDYEDFIATSVLGLRSMAKYKGANSGKLVTFDFNGEAVSTHKDLDHYLYDDLYGYSLGFLQNQGLDTSLMANRTAWEELSRQQCEKIQAKYQFTEDELIFMDLLDENLPIYAKCHCSAGESLPLFLRMAPSVMKRANYQNAQKCEKITPREFAKHHYMKCALGYKNSAADMAYLHGRACLLEGNRIGHFHECPWSPAGVKP